MRILLAYGYSQETLPVYWERALRKKHQVITCGPSNGRPQDIPCAATASILDIWEQIPGEKPELIIWAESIPRFLLWDLERAPVPTAFYASDAYLGRLWQPNFARYFDHVFVSGKYDLDLFHKVGCANVTWLEGACDPEIHREHQVEQVYDLCFLGTFNPVIYPERGQYLDRIQRLAREKGLRVFIGNGHYGENLAKLFSQSKIVFNNTFYSPYFNPIFNRRVYEAMSCNRLALTDRWSGGGLPEVFEDGQHVVLYDADDFEDKLLFYLEHEEERVRIARQGFEEVRNKHTYDHRMEQLLAAVAAGKETPWVKQEVLAGGRTASYYHDYGVAAYCQNLYAGAAACLGQATECDLADPVLWHDLGVAQAMAGNGLQAVQALTQALDLDRSFLAARSNLAHLFFAAKDYPRAAAEHQTVLQALANSGPGPFKGLYYPDGWTWVKMAWLKMANWPRQAGQDEAEAAEEFRRVLSARAHEQLGSAAFLRSDCAGAAEQWCKAAPYFEQYDIVQSFLGTACYQLGQVPEAIDWLRRAKQAQGLNVNASSTLARLLKLANRPEEAIAEYEYALQTIATLRGLGFRLEAGLEQALTRELNELTAGRERDDLPAYYRFARPEVQALVPATARRVLDVGCAGGALGAALKARGVEEVIGLESDPKAATQAAKQLDQVITGDVEMLKDALPLNHFDCIVLADVLEHLREPGAVLTRLAQSLTKDGAVVASLPNVGHWSVIRALLEGRWQYEEAGLLDRTHLRFFTRRSILALFNEAGLRVEQLQAVNVPGETIPAGLVAAVKAAGLAVENLQAESAVYQYLVRAHPRKPALTSIIILTCNELEYTRRCVESIREHTAEPYELIFVDNGSTDGTLEYLRTLAGAKIIANPLNLGFGTGCNQGLDAAEGDYLVLLNNDTLVTDGWLTRMIARVESDSLVGAVGPRSNYVAGPQVIKPVPYGDDLSRMPEFAARLAADQAGQSFPVLRLVGFCLLMKRAVVEKVGGFDERFGLGNFEDDDFCIRAWLAGFSLLVCDDVFIHHFGSRTFAGAKLDYRQMMLRNWERFKEKWNLPADRPIDAGYQAKEVMGRPFDPELHYSSPSRTAAETAAYLKRAFPKRQFSFLARLDWPAGQAAFAEVLGAYLAAFGPEDDVSLVVLVEPGGPAELVQAGKWLRETLEAQGIEPEKAPDILVSLPPGSPRDRLALHQSVQAFIRAGEALVEKDRQELQACGCCLVEECVPECLRALALSS